MKQQVVVIHGGDNFGTYKEYISFLRKRKIGFERCRTGMGDWKKTLGKALGRNFEVILPDMPNKMNARYVEWRIWFKKFIPYLRKNVILVGHSLGGTFLAKYLSENKFPKKIRATFLVAACYDEKDADYSLVDFKLPKSLKKLQKQGGAIFIYQSKDDKVVPFADFGKYQKSLPNAVCRTFSNRGHFKQSKLPELVKDIKRL